MQEKYEYNYFLVMHALVCKYNKNRLPREIVLEIKVKCDEVRTELRQETNRRRFGVGISRSAAKRRAKRLERCYKCGKFFHEGKCPENQTHSNFEFLRLIQNGPVDCYVNQTLNKRGYAYGRMCEQLERLSEEAAKRGLTNSSPSTSWKKKCVCIYLRFLLSVKNICRNA